MNYEIHFDASSVACKMFHVPIRAAQAYHIPLKGNTKLYKTGQSDGHLGGAGAE